MSPAPADSIALRVLPPTGWKRPPSFSPLFSPTTSVALIDPWRIRARQTLPTCGSLLMLKTTPSSGPSLVQVTSSPPELNTECVAGFGEKLASQWTISSSPTPLSGLHRNTGISAPAAMAWGMCAVNCSSVRDSDSRYSMTTSSSSQASMTRSHRRLRQSPSVTTETEEKPEPL